MIRVLPAGCLARRRLRSRRDLCPLYGPMLVVVIGHREELVRRGERHDLDTLAVEIEHDRVAAAAVTAAAIAAIVAAAVVVAGPVVLGLRTPRRDTGSSVRGCRARLPS
jgi:hypothetical protein